jgi:hypothetical protein
MGADNLKKLEFKRMLKRYESSLEDLEYLREMASHIGSEFSSALAAKKRPDLFESKRVEEMAKEAADEKEQKEEVDKDPLFKKLFRKIVVLCHPDRMDPDLPLTEKANLLNLYDMAIKASDTNSWAGIIVVAIKLGVELDDAYMEHVDKIQNDAKKIEEEIESIQGSVAWTWYHISDDSKDHILNSYISHMEEALLKSLPQDKLILGVGHPRTGTGYTTKLLQSMGLNVLHEKMGEDGIVAWQFATKLKNKPFIASGLDKQTFRFNTIIYNVRNPLHSIPSIVHTESKTLEFRMHAGKFKESENVVETAVRSILAWDTMIRAMKPHFTYRIEDQSEALFEFLKERGLDIKRPDNIGVQNARPHAGLTDELKEQLQKMPFDVKVSLNLYCRSYGYPDIC